jgi:hypothetical protein
VRAILLRSTGVGRRGAVGLPDAPSSDTRDRRPARRRGCRRRRSATTRCATDRCAHRNRDRRRQAASRLGT